MEQFDGKVSLESLHTTKIKEINYEGDETYQERPTLSQRLTELAQRMDFSSEDVEGESSEPAAKKSTQKWPWEYTHSKLKQALTEVSVLSDVLAMAQNHRQYIRMDPVVAQPSSSVSPTYQYIVKKKALGVAAGFLRKGTKTLSHASSRGEREFHRALSNLRQRWRLRRTPLGTIVGDLSYHSAGSQYGSAATFEVHKGLEEGNKREVMSVTIPHELRGRSEILVFLGDRPVREVGGMDSFCPPRVEELVKHHDSLPPWEQKLVAAQNVLFNQELFSQLAREAYDQKTTLQHEVFSNRVIIPLSMDYWLSVLHVREYDSDGRQRPTAGDLPPLRWDLVMALKQLLRESHNRRANIQAPQPTTASFVESPTLKNVGVSAIKASQLKKMVQAQNESVIFNQFIQKAKHLYNEERLERWLLELCSVSSDPVLAVSWVPDIALSSTTVNLHFTYPPASSSNSRTLALILKAEQVTFQQIDGKALTIPLEKERLLGILRHQVVVHRMLIACQISEEQKWHILQRFHRPLLSHTLAKSAGGVMEACNIVLESQDAHKKLDVLLEWNKVTVCLTQYASGFTTSTEDIATLVPKSRTFILDSQFGHTFQQRFTSMLNSVSNAH